MQADIIIENGRLITFDPARPAAEAIALGGGVILAVGAAADMAGLRGPATRVIDAGGGTVLPGFIDSHVHLFMGAAELDMLNLTGVAGEAALAAALRGRAAARPEDRLVMACSADYHVLGEGREIDRHALDALLPDRPVALMAPDHHTVWANTAALEAAGILHGFDAGEGSTVVMGGDGKATGMLLENGAFGPVMALMPSGGREGLGYVTGEDPVPPAGPAERAADKAVIAKGLRHCAAKGITTLHNMDGNFYQLELLKSLEEDGDLLCRIQVPFHLKNHHPLEKLDEAVGMHRRFIGDWVWSGRVKMFMDGVLESRTALMLEPYPDRPGWRGEALFSPEHFNEACVMADARSLQISVHAIGDAAVRRTLDGYAAARAANGARDSRHRVEHIEALAPEDLPRFAELGVIASMQPLHAPVAGFFTPWPPDTIFSRAQMARAFPWRDLLESGARLIFSTDWPVVPVDVMPGLKGAVAGVPLPEEWGDQRVGLRQALAAYTCENAYAEFTEARKGRLVPGMMADVVVLSRDIEAMPAEELDRVAPVLTIAGGRITFEG